MRTRDWIPLDSFFSNAIHMKLVRAKNNSRYKHTKECLFWLGGGGGGGNACLNWTFLMAGVGELKTNSWILRDLSGGDLVSCIQELQVVYVVSSIRYVQPKAMLVCVKIFPEHPMWDENLLFTTVSEYDGHSHRRLFHWGEPSLSGCTIRKGVVKVRLPQRYYRHHYILHHHHDQSRCS